MKFKKLLALLVAFILCFGVVTATGAEAMLNKAPVSDELLTAQLLDFSGRLNEMLRTKTPAELRAPQDGDLYSTARLIVKSTGALDTSGSLAHVSGYNNWTIIQYATPAEAKKAAENFIGQRGVEYAASDALMQADQIPNVDSFLSYGYYEECVGAYEFNQWLLERAGSVEALPEIIVGVIDTGVDSDHENFIGRLVPGYDFGDNDDDPEDETGHGTLVSGTVLDGTLPNVKVMGLKVKNSNYEMTESCVLMAMEYAYLNGCHAVNISLTGEYDEQNYLAFDDVVNRGSDHGTVYCTSAGNNGVDAGDYLPGCVERILTVAAHGKDNVLYPFSNYGDCVDICAAGVGVTCTKMGGGTTVSGGTSISCPHVAAVCAMIFTFDQSLPADEVMRLIKDASIAPRSTGGGAGVLSAANLLKFDTLNTEEGDTLLFTTCFDYPWRVNNNGAAVCGNTGVNDSVSTLTARVMLSKRQYIRFEYRAVSEQDSDFFRFMVGDEVYLELSGQNGTWQTFECYVEGMEGEAMLSWEFIKDASGALGIDRALIRNVVCTAAPVEALPGDANGDGAVTMTDAILVLRYAMQLITELPCPENADVDGNGFVSVTDALIILHLATSLLAP